MTFADHPLTAEQVKLLIREGEGLTVEFKERYTPRIDEDIVAFANARGGTLLLGVRDNGTVVGERLTNDLKAKINSLARNCKPAITTELSQVGEVVAVVVAKGTEKPYSCSSGYYRRLDGNTQKISHDELRIMFAENEPLPFEEKAVKGFTFDDVSKAKIRAFVDEAGIRIGSTPVPDFLRSLRVADEARVKNAGILFFAKDVYGHLHQAQMTLLAFKGTERLHIYDRRDVRDDLLTQLNEAVAFLGKHLNVRSEIRGLNREDIYEIPLEVLREALVNALMHRDYSITGTQISVEVYDDRVEIVNPGGLLKGLSVRDLGTVSIRRNELIAGPLLPRAQGRAHRHGDPKDEGGHGRGGLARTDLRERRVLSRNVPTVTRVCHERRPARHRGNRKGARGKNYPRNYPENYPENHYPNSAESRDNPPRVGSRTGITDSGVKYHLRKMQEKGLLRRVGPDKGGHWELIP